VALKDRDGDTRKVGARKLRAQIAAEVTATRGFPSCPEHLKGLARDAWNYWSAELADMNLDRRPDAMALEGACIAYESLIFAYDHIQKYSRLLPKKEKVVRMVEDPHAARMVRTEEMVVSVVTTNPAVRIADQASKQLRSFCSEFGFTAVSRTRQTVSATSSKESSSTRQTSGGASRFSSAPGRRTRSRRFSDSR
jgi:P27 family predicted phage terminase small subunit